MHKASRCTAEKHACLHLSKQMLGLFSRPDRVTTANYPLGFRTVAHRMCVLVHNNTPSERISAEGLSSQFVCVSAWTQNAGARLPFIYPCDYSSSFSYFQKSHSGEEHDLWIGLWLLERQLPGECVSVRYRSLLTRTHTRPDRAHKGSDINFLH